MSSSHSHGRNAKYNRTFKRICALSDGTWLTADSETPSNILHLTKLISREDPNGIQQILLYDAGVGTSGPIDRWTGGLFGAGLDANIKQLYMYISLNYEPGDEIYLFGFSRGAYTVRSLAGMMHTSGLVRRDAVEFVHEAYELYRESSNSDSKEAKEFRKLHGDRAPIKCLACFDTVGALGVPHTLFGINTPGSWQSRYEFHDVSINENIEHAIHMLSIDENRIAYTPTRMKPSEKRSKSQITSFFFWGTHTGVGGGNRWLLPASQTTLCFLLDEMKRRGCQLAFDKDLTYPPVAADVTVLSNSTRSRIIRTVSGAGPRNIKSVKNLHWTAVRRWKDVKTWRPEALDKFSFELYHMDWEEVKKIQEE